MLDFVAEQKNAESVRIGLLIKDLRERKGWSQQDLANELNMGVSTVSRWERGLHKGYPGNAQKLADALEVDVAVLRPIEPQFQTQLDRIERDVAQIRTLLTGASPAETIADLVARLEAVAGSLPPKAPGQSASPPEDKRRRSA